jgi:H+-transporting ATPase
LFANGVGKDQAIILAARASRSQHELYIEPIDATILSLLDDPKRVPFLSLWCLLIPICLYVY